MSVSRRSAAVVPALVGVVATAVALAVCWASPTPLTLRLDNLLVFYPVVVRVWHTWAAGRVPMWTDGMWAGFPLAADQAMGVFYLPHALAIAATPWPHVRAFDLATALHEGLLAAGTVVLVRDLGGRAAGGAVAAALVLVGYHVQQWAAAYL